MNKGAITGLTSYTTDGLQQEAVFSLCITRIAMPESEIEKYNKNEYILVTECFRRKSYTSYYDGTAGDQTGNN